MMVLVRHQKLRTKYLSSYIPMQEMLLVHLTFVAPIVSWEYEPTSSCKIRDDLMKEADIREFVHFLGITLHIAEGCTM